MADIAQRVTEHGRRAKQAAALLATTTAHQRNEALAKIAELLRLRAPEIIAENARDMQAGEQAGLSSAMLDRLKLDEVRIGKIAAAVRRHLLPDPWGGCWRNGRAPTACISRRSRCRWA